MTTSLFVALIGDLILLPCLLYMRPSKAVAAKPGASESDERARHIPEPHLGKPRRSTESTGLDDDAEGCFV
jgi:hypothetical protein